MKRFLIFTLLLLFAVYSNAHTEEPDPLSFFPHHVGDTWAYLYEGTTVLNSTFTHVEQDKERNVWIYLNNNADAAYKIDSNYNVYFSPTGGNYLDYKLTAGEGDVWVVQKDHTAGTNMCAIVQDVYKTFVFGQHTTVKEIAYYLVPKPDTIITDNSAYVYTQFIASGFGFIRQIGESGDVPIDLVGCIINGDTFGVVTNIEERNPGTSSLQLSALPNPCSSFVTFHCALPESVQTASIELLDIFGRIVHSYDIQADGYTLNTSTFPDGIYFCRVTAGTHTATQKIIVHK